MLTDSFMRNHDYLRVSVTDKCNLRCSYCMPPEGIEWMPHGMVLRNEEFVRLISIFSEMGIKKVRFTGGEPLLRKGLLDIIEQVRRDAPELELCLTTNATLLEDYVPHLERLSVHQLNISLDTLDEERYAFITRSAGLNQVLQNIDRSLERNFFSIKINAVLFKETLDEIETFLEYFKDRNVVLRFIERMPFTKQEQGNSFISSSMLINRLKDFGSLVRVQGMDTRVADMYELIYRDNHHIKLGFISPMSHKFCSSCNRLRLTSNGRMKTCLHGKDGFDLMAPIRSGADNDALKEIIIQGISVKHEGHSLCIDSDTGGCSSISANIMSRIGG